MPPRPRIRFATSADLIIVGLAEILTDDPVADTVEFRPVHSALPNDGVVGGIALVPGVVGIVIGPHEVKPHIPVVFGF